MSEYILSLDQGTTGTTAVLIDVKNFSLIGKVNKEFRQIYPKPGQVEHDLNDIWSTVEQTVKELLKKHNINSKDIKGIGITNQRETTCAFKHTGEPLTNAIVWQDRRTTEYCESLDNSSHAEFIKKTTGLTIDPYFSGSKMNYLLQTNSQVQDAAKQADLRFGTIDTFLLYKLTNGKSFKTEPSNASRTLLMNLETTDWDQKLLDIFEIKKEYLPEIIDSFGDFGHTSGLNFLPDGIPICGILGDQQAALFGQAGFKIGDMKCTYGTGAFLLVNTGKDILFSKNGLLTTVGYRYKNETFYALEGSCYIAGAAVQFLRDNFKMINSAADVEQLALEVSDYSQMEYLMFLPFFTGIGSPYWKPNAKGAIVGLTRDTEFKHMAKACLDGIALSINDLVEACKEDASFDISSLKVDGGACANNLLMQTQATVSSLEIIRPNVIETTAYGAALGCAVGLGLIEFSDIEKLWQKDQSFTAESKHTDFYNKKKKNWKEYIQRCF